MLASCFTFTASADTNSSREALQQKIEQAENSYPPPGSNPLNGTVGALNDAIDEELYTTAKEKFLEALSHGEGQFMQVGGNYNNETYYNFVEVYERILAIHESGAVLTSEEYFDLAEELEAAMLQAIYDTRNAVDGLVL